MRLNSLVVATVGLLALAATAQCQDPGNERVRTRAPGVIDTGAPKVCVKEPTPTTKVVYVVEVKEYCKPHSSFLDIITGSCNSCNNSCGSCELHTKRVLIKKIIPGPDKMQCVVRDGPPCDTCAPDGTVPAK